jgi:hypothetical protein
MYKITCEITLTNPNYFGKLKLKMRRGSGFWINECYYYNYKLDEFGTYLTVDSYVYDGDLTVKDIVRRRAIGNIERANKLVNFLFGFKLIDEYPNHSRRPLVAVKKIPPTPLKSSENINKIHKFMSSLNNVVKSDKKKERDNEEKLRKKYYAAINYFVRSLDAMDVELYEDALLSLYRGLEVLAREEYKNIKQDITNDFRKYFIKFLDETLNEVYGEKHRELFNAFESVMTNKLMTDTRIILKVLQEFRVFPDEKISNIKELCRVRNSFSHGNTEENDIPLKLFADGQHVLRSMIALILLKKSYNKAFPITDID